MEPTLSLLRAIGAEFFRRTVRPPMVIGAVAAVLLVAASSYLTTLSAWWWVLWVIVVAWVLVFASVAVGVLIAMRIVDPPQSSDQRQAVRRYVDKLQRVAEHMQTPRLVVLSRVVRDTLRPQENTETFIATVSRDTKTLTPDFVALQEEFRTKRRTAR